MKKRDSDILIRLLSAPAYSLAADQVTDRCGITWRTLQNDIKEINDFLKEIHAGHVEINDKKILNLKLLKSAEVIKEELFNMSSYVYRFSPRERQIYIMVSLAVAESYLTMEQLANDMEVTRITVLNDFDKIKEELQLYDLHIRIKSRRGDVLTGGEQNIRHLLAHLMEECFDMGNEEGYFQTIILRKISPEYSYKTISHVLKCFLQEYEIEFSDIFFKKLAIFLFININRYCAMEYLPKMKTTIAPLADDMIDYFNSKLDLDMGWREVSWLSLQMRQENIRPLKQFSDNIDLYGDVYIFLRKISEHHQLGLEQDEKLREALVLHLTNGKIPEEIAMDFELSGSEIMQEEIDEIVEDIHENKEILERHLDYKIEGKTIYAICIHICAAIIRNRSYRNGLNVLIVCPGSVATGRLVEEQVRDYFDFDTTRIVSTYKLKEELNQNVDFVISTVEVPTGETPLILVKPFLTLEDLNKIQQFVYRTRRSGSKDTNTKIKKDNTTVRQQLIRWMDDIGSDKMRDEFYQAVNELSLQKKEKINTLQDMISPERITIQYENVTWQQAIQLSAQPLIKEHYISQQYVQKAIDNVSELGPYIVVAPRIAIAHAEPRYGALKDGFSLLVAKNPIDFGDEIQIDLLFCFATTGKEEYADVLKEIVSLDEKRNLMERILNAGNAEEIYELINSSTY